MNPSFNSIWVVSSQNSPKRVTVHAVTADRMVRLSGLPVQGISTAEGLIGSGLSLAERTTESYLEAIDSANGWKAYLLNLELIDFFTIRRYPL